MDGDNPRARLLRLIRPVIEELGLELVQLEYGSGRGAHLRVYIDKPGGVTIADCETVSRALSDLLDAHDPIPRSYVLEVSSPGVERPLGGAGDFQRFLGEAVKVYTREPVAGRKSFAGKLSAAAEDHIEVVLEEGKRFAIPLKSITKAHLWYRP